MDDTQNSGLFLLLLFHVSGSFLSDVPDPRVSLAQDCLSSEKQ